MIDRFLDDVDTFLEHTNTAWDASIIQSHQEAVFEGAQGLRLDEINGTFPYVTRSRTGSLNPLLLLTAADRHKETAKIHYVTRAYTTRHGAGPLTDETPGHPYGWTGPETNITNTYQGSFRYAPLNISELKAAIERDSPTDKWDRQLDVTCLDQHPEPEALLDRLHQETGLPIGLRSYSAGETQ